jgi:hypothetical protein
MHIEGMRLRPKTYRFELPEGITVDDLQISMSVTGRVLTPRDYESEQINNSLTITLKQDVPSAGGLISLFAFTNARPRGRPKSKS